MALCFVYFVLILSTLTHIDARKEATIAVFPRRSLLEKTTPKEECPRMFAPYLSSIRDMSGNHNCGGIVIAKNAVLTSASCVDRRVKNTIAEKPLVHIGGFDSNQPVQRRFAEVVIIHPKWNGNPIDGFDLAIIKLDTPTCVLPVKFLGKRDSEQTAFVALGYGRTGSRGTFSSSELQGTDVNLLNRDDCNAKIGAHEQTDWGELCFQSPAGGARICAGDEGGPILHAPASRANEDSLIGIASFTTGNCDDPRSVAVATNVRRFTTWIQDTLKSDIFTGKLNKGHEKRSPRFKSKKNN